MNFLSLFSGIGGFDLGAYWAGLRFENHYYSDIDPYANNVFQLRFPDAIPLGDICKISGKELPDGEWIIAGGFPCTDISNQGCKIGLSGQRSGLWYEMLRLIGEIRPGFVVVENVAALVNRGLSNVVAGLSSIGYDCEWDIIPASALGAPHQRKRLWIIAYPKCKRPQGSGGLINAIHSAPEAYREASDVIHAFQRDALPYVCRRHDGLSSAMDRLQCLGNSIDPKIAELIFRRIRELL